MNTNKARPDFRQLLASRGIKPTYQRLEILRYLVETRCHPTADAMYRALVRRIPMLSKTTVYNTLNRFVETGLAVALSITGTEVRFDAAVENHHHFLCDRCGSITDVAVSCPNCGRDRIDGHLIREIHGYFKGVCRSCIESEKRKGG